MGDLRRGLGVLLGFGKALRPLAHIGNSHGGAVAVAVIGSGASAFKPVGKPAAVTRVGIELSELVKTLHKPFLERFGTELSVMLRKRFRYRYRHHCIVGKHTLRHKKLKILGLYIVKLID